MGASAVGKRPILGMFVLGVICLVSCGGATAEDKTDLIDKCRSFDGDAMCGRDAVPGCTPVQLPHHDGTVYCRLRCQQPGECPSGYGCKTYGRTEQLDPLAACIEDALWSSPNNSEKCSAFDGDATCGGGEIPHCASFVPFGTDTPACLVQCAGPGIEVVGDCPKGYECQQVVSEGPELAACVKE